MNELTNHLKRLTKNIAYEMPDITCMTYTEEDYNKRKRWNVVRDCILYSIMFIGLIATAWCIAQVINSCCG